MGGCCETNYDGRYDFEDDNDANDTSHIIKKPSSHPNLFDHLDRRTMTETQNEYNLAKFPMTKMQKYLSFIDDIWDEFDENNSGSVGVSQVENILKDYISHARTGLSN